MASCNDALDSPTRALMLDSHIFRDLYPAAFKAYVYTAKHLDREHWAPLKVEVVMLGCRLKRDSAIRAMRCLVKRKYLARRGGGPKPYEYRLLPAPMPMPTMPVKVRAA